MVLGCTILLMLICSSFALSPVHDVTLARASEAIELLPSCGPTANGYSCVGIVDQQLVIPCGKLSDQNGLSFTYFSPSNQQVLLSNSISFLHWYPQWNDTGRKICCTPDIPISPLDVPCYTLTILYPPIPVPTRWPAGINKYPVLGSPFELHCPLQSNPPANYTWTYHSLDGRERLSIPNDVILTDRGRRIIFTEYTANYNGIYECHAENELGAEDYSNDGLFFLKPNACSNAQTNPLMTITPLNTSYPLGANITLTCTVHSAYTFGLRPVWLVIRNGTKELCRPPDYRQLPHYSDETCSWRNELVLRGFHRGQEGSFVCQYGEETQLVELKIDAPADFQNNGRGLVTIATSIGGATIVIMLLLVGQRVSCAVLVSLNATREPKMTGFRYDVFISAHDEMRNLVQHKILDPLERSNPPYRVCWHLRDFIAGLSITEQIADAVQNSRKVLFVFSEQFSQSKFCQLEFELAMNRLAITNTRCLVPIATSETAVPESLRSTMTYWPVVLASESDLGEKLRQLLGDPIKQHIGPIREKG